MAKNFEIWVKEHNQFIQLEDELKYINYVNTFIRDSDLIEEHLTLHFYLRGLVGGRIKRA